MVASGFPKFFRNQSNSSSKIVNYFRKAHSPLQTPFLMTRIPQITKPIDQFPSFDRLRTQDIKGSRFTGSDFYPSFSFQLFLNQDSAIFPNQSALDNGIAVNDDSRTIRADSVKKKRKKKMNKHKLRKLRKRLRRKT